MKPWSKQFRCLCEHPDNFGHLLHNPTLKCLHFTSHCELLFADEWMQLELVPCFSVWRLHVLSVFIMWHMLSNALWLTNIVLLFYTFVIWTMSWAQNKLCFPLIVTSLIFLLSLHVHMHWPGILRSIFFPVGVCNEPHHIPLTVY